MGSDDLFKKRKARKLRDISRKKRTRELYKRVLIVCEGQKTEPLYFNSLREEYRLQATDICITNAKGSDPMSLVKYAIDLYKDSQKVGNDFDFVFCVFDKDDHANYKQAINEISKIRLSFTLSHLCLVLNFGYFYTFAARQNHSDQSKVNLLQNKLFANYKITYHDIRKEIKTRLS